MVVPLEICVLNLSLKSMVTHSNYADDNTLSKSDKTLEKVISALEEDSNSLINWFSANKMQANPEKFQAISVGRKTHDKVLSDIDKVLSSA
jgi:succinate dehydrogenase flavin-adding protein (antitoxin of CptAB toxin-antitoxin module)